MIKNKMRTHITVFFCLISFSCFAQSITYTYDDLNLLTEASYSDGTVISYQYDKLGNMIGKTLLPGGAICTSNLNISGIVSAGQHQSQGQLTATNATVQNGTSVDFTSDTGILLQSNFTVQLGADFDAFIQACSNFMNGSQNNNSTTENIQGINHAEEKTEAEKIKQ